MLPVQGTSGISSLSMGDHWGNAMGEGTVNDFPYVWLPLTFPARATMNMPWYPHLAVDTATATATATVAGAGGGPCYSLVARHSGKCLDITDTPPPTVPS